MRNSSIKKLIEQLNYKKIMNSLEILITISLAAIIYYPPYLQGLFFEKQILPTGIFIFSLFFVFFIYKWIKKDYVMFKTPIDYVSLSFVAVYFISIFVAVHTRSAIIELLKYCMYFAVFYMITNISESKRIKLIFLWTIIASAVGVSIIGLDSAIGGNLVGSLNKLFNFLGVQGDMFFGLFVDDRINSTLQYPNALASYVMAIFFVVIGLILSSKKRWVRTICGICAYILFLTFMLTESRGAQLIFPLALIIFIIMSPKGYRITTAAYTVILTIPAVCVSLIISPYLSETVLSKWALLLMAIGLIASVLLTLIINRISTLLQKINWKIYLVLTLILITLLPVGINLVLNSSIPLQLSHDIGEPDGIKMVSRDLTLTPGKEYTLTYSSEISMEVDQQYAYNVRISSKSRKNILFYGDTELVNQNYKENFGSENKIQFIVPKDSKLINICFYNYYSGTGVTIDNVKVVDTLTGQVVKKIALKNKYSLDTLIDRFNNIRYDSSGLSRIIFYKDGVEIFINRWLLGGGGGAWEYLYRKYQSYNYMSTQAHNYPLQLGIETGILGLLALVLLLVVLLNCYVEYYKKHNTKDLNVINDKRFEKDKTNAFLFASIITAIVSLFSHSIIDFDFSEASILLLFWQLIAVLNNEFKQSLKFREMLPFVNKVEKGRKHSPAISKGKISICINVIITFTLLVFCINFIQASSYAKKAFNNLMENNIEEAINNMFKAIEKDRYNERYVIGHNPVVTRPDIKAGLADILLIKTDSIQVREQNGEQITQTELTQLQRQFAVLNNHMKQIEKKADNNILLSNNLASFYFSTGQIEKGIEYLNKSLELFPFEPSLWYSKIRVYFQLMSQYYNNNDYENAQKYLDLGLDVIDESKGANVRNMNPFVFSSNTMELLQKMDYMKDYWGKDELTHINDIIHYTIPDMDIDMDQIPDQWISSDINYINVTASIEGIYVNVESGIQYIRTRNLLKFERGKTYIIEVELNKPVDVVYYELAQITGITAFQQVGDDKYRAEVTVENEPNEDGNQLRIYLDSDNVLEQISVMQKE